MTLFTELSLDQQISALVEGRKPSEKQIEFVIYLIDAGVLSGASDGAAFIQAKRDYDRAQREAKGEPEVRTPKAQQIIQALSAQRSEAEEGASDDYLRAMDDSISIAGRFV